ncbi:RNA polymerase sigma-70 factor [Butyricimonas paravirosa]|uniref:RNA polymerase sigma-70 factor n=1 Tax=Butyricimonas paravirosa TaxID=1472417 RepID=UPI0022DEDACE|nr:RNA polymerase sigma-70 factor [Butyricimonas paravirosa]MBS7196732.1 RNA polymerase sigma-70 factor [Bacteroidales bacterium]
MAPFISIDIERLINGDEKVFKSLFDYSYVGMVQRAVYYTNDLDTAEDIVQEVFMRLWEKREELRGIQNIQGYLLFSIRNKCLNLLEHQQVMDKYRQYCLLQEVSDEEDEPETFIEKVGNLLNKLPEKRRKVLEMSVLESKSYAEIAASLSISLNTVKDHIKKAYAFLREEVCKDISSPVLFCAFCYREKCI